MRPSGLTGSTFQPITHRRVAKLRESDVTVQRIQDNLNVIV
jgi:hypothetical protein